jgi:ribonuclease-3
VATTPAGKRSRRSNKSPGLDALGVPTRRRAVYELALTHRSYAFERGDGSEHNERLEFLGDAILETVVTDLIFNTYPEMTEGGMARLRASVVNTVALAKLARTVSIGDEVLLGRGEEASGGRDKDHILADTFEAVVGAVYVDRGMETVRDHLVPLFEALISIEVTAERRYDAKTALQEFSVRKHGKLPEYRVASSGPDHDKQFTATVFLDTKRSGEGSGRSKKEAEQNAAREALDTLKDSLTAEGDPRVGAS